MNRGADLPAFNQRFRFTPGALAWAAFLGCSWTWCIGMFLPVLLVRDYGLAGWIVFAIPNVVGAAAMGWVLPDAESSRRFLQRHGSAAAAFSLVTIAFHLFFMGWVVHGLIGSLGWMLLPPLLLIQLAMLWRVRTVLVASALTFGLSVVGFAVAFVSESHWPGLSLTGRASGFDLVGLLPVCMFGFALCPYLDLTFHRARQATRDAEGATAFTLGFGVFFASMILFTLWYAPILALEKWSSVRRPVALAIALHVTLQSSFTIAAHLEGLLAIGGGVGLGRSASKGLFRIAGVQPVAPLGNSSDSSAKLGLSSDEHRLEGRDTENSAATGFNAAVGTLIGAAIGTAIIFGWLANWIPARAGIGSSEVGYRLFLGCYGLVFPAYLWWSLILSSRRWTMGLGVLAALSLGFSGYCFWLGFVEGRMLVLIPGVAVILIAPLIPLIRGGKGNWRAETFTSGSRTQRRAVVPPDV